MAYRTCFLCGRNGSSDPLDKHHIFEGVYRKKSEKYGLYVYLCHDSCHIFGKNSVHCNCQTMQLLHEYGQALAMQKNHWTMEEFQAEFGKNYFAHPQTGKNSGGSFLLLEEEESLPF